MGNISHTIRPMFKYMVTEILLCGLGSLVSERHLLFPKARAPTTSRFIYATHVSEGQGVSKHHIALILLHDRKFKL